MRGRTFVRTTLADDISQRPRDLVRRQFRATGPNQLWVADLTYGATWRGCVYVIFVIDVFARRIVGSRPSTSLRSDLALDALDQALYDRPTTASSRLIHHRDRGVQRCTDRPAVARIEPSVGSTGDSHDDALAETVIGLYKTELIRRPGPGRGVDDIELTTLTWVASYNADRLLEPLGYVPPAEFEQAFFDRQGNAAQLAGLK